MKHLNLLKIESKIYKTILLFFIFLFSFANSQSKRFYYVMNYKIDTLSTYKTDLMVLEINEKNNYFFSDEYLKADSISSRTKKQIIPQPVFEDIIIWNKSSQEFSFIKTLSMNFYKYNSVKKINWSITNEIKKIGSYNVRKAKTNFSGRNWTAWFCDEIPLPYGPYFFYGLPGLILEVYDDDSNFYFSFFKNYNFKENSNTDKLIEKATGSFLVNIKEVDWKAVQINYYNNPMSEYKNGDAYMTKDNGEVFTANDYKNMELQIQNQIKSFNNPIELSEKIHYK